MKNRIFIGLISLSTLTFALAKTPLPTKKELRKTLTPMQYKVTQEEGTEPAYKNEYWDSIKPGIYVDVVSGEALFSSLDKYDSKTGWPSFTKPIDETKIETKKDFSFFGPRIEIHTKKSGSHLGHIFDDGPQDKGGKRYCINSAALRFVPLEEMKQQGYEQFLPLFKNNTK